MHRADEQSVEVGSAVLEPSAGTVTQQRLADGTICSGHTFFPDGRLLVCGSERKREGVHAIRVFTPNLNGGDWEQVAEMKDARWYPTCSRLPDGRIAIIGKRISRFQTFHADHVIIIPDDRKPLQTRLIICIQSDGRSCTEIAGRVNPLIVICKNNWQC